MTQFNSVRIITNNFVAPSRGVARTGRMMRLLRAAESKENQSGLRNEYFKARRNWFSELNNSNIL